MLRIWYGGKLFGAQVMRPPFGGRPAFTILLLGLDQPDRLNPEKGRRSDTILLARVDLATRTVRGFNIPRDTRVRLEEDGRWKKINASYQEGEIELTTSVVQNITGVIPDYYMVVDTASTEGLVDMVGGVWIDVDKRMKYVDTWQDLRIDLQKGYQKLDGNGAVGYIRFRHDATGDLARMERQQKFIRALAKQMVEPHNITRLPGVVRELRKQVLTNMRSDDLLYLANTFRDVPSSQLEFQSLPGESRTIGGVSYYLPFRDKMEELITYCFPGATIPEDALVDTL